MVLERFFQRDASKDAARSLYEAVIAQARQPAFYRHCGVPDSLDGRFELISLHGFLVLRQLRGLGVEAEVVAQGFVDILALDFDRSLREMGVGDLSVGKRVRRMVEAFRGRIAAYEEGLAGGGEALDAALRRNAFGTVSPEPAQVAALAAYLAREAAQPPAAGLLEGALAFGPPPESGAQNGAQNGAQSGAQNEGQNSGFGAPKGD